MKICVRTRCILASLSLVALVAPANVSAQATGRLTGTITDSTTRQPIPGVQVMVVGTTLGTVTSDDGRFTFLAVRPGAVTVRAQRLGYGAATQSATVVAGETATVDFSLAPVARVLSEVVAVGYGTSLREDVSGAISSVSGTELQNSAIAGVDAALQGKAPGVQVIQNAGNPGVGITVRVRGAASLSASNQPLWVIDGVPMLREDFSQIGVGGQDITAVTGISPDEIESIDILKDAASAAIYGSRASNGVVMITTKRGRAGRPNISFNAYRGVQDITKKLDLINASEFVEYMNEARTNDGRALRYRPGIDDAVSTDWQAEVLRTAPVSDLFMSADGGTERLRYYLSGSYFEQEGIVLGSGYDREAIRANVDFDASSRLSFRSSMSFSREAHDRITNDDTIEGVMANAIAEVPMFPVRQPDGRFTDVNDAVGVPDNRLFLGYINPVAVGELNFRESRSLRGLGNIEGTFRFTDKLRLSARAGLDVINLRDLRWDSPRIIGSSGARAVGISIQGNNNVSKYVAETFLGYDHSGGFGLLSLTGGASVEYNQEEDDLLRGEGFAHPEFQYPGNAGAVTEYQGDRTGHNLVSFFSRANLTLGERYLASASIRADGSSRFGKNNRYGVFPAVSVGWFITREPFMQRLAPNLDLKLRASYGETGNQDIGDDFASIARYSEAKYAGAPGIAPENIANPDLRWETTREFDVGFDLSLLAGRLVFLADYYVKKTDDLLVQRPITRTSGFTSFWDNVGNIENKGLELGVTSVNLEPAVADGLRWETNFNISWNKNRVTRLFNNEPFGRGYDEINRYEPGHAMGEFYIVRFIGVDPATGDAMFEDFDGDGVTGDDADDRVFVGSPHPNHWGGLTNTLTFRGFDLRAFVQFSQGAEIYNALRAYADDGGFSSVDNKLQSVMRRWRKSGDITDVPRASSRCRSNACLPSSRWIEDASYVRLQEVTLGYRLPSRVSGLANLQDARIFVSGRNLHIWTDFEGFNPEANSAGSNSLTTLATEFYSYPLARTISIGVRGSW